MGWVIISIIALAGGKTGLKVYKERHPIVSTNYISVLPTEEGQCLLCSPTPPAVVHQADAGLERRRRAAGIRRRK